MSAFLALLSAFCNGCSAVLQRLANIDAPPDKGVVKVAWFLIRQPLWLLGGAFLVGTLLFSAGALYFGTLAVVQPLLVTELVFTLGLRQVWLHDRIPGRSWLAALLICGGLAGFLVIAQPKEGSRVPTLGMWLVVVFTRAAVVGILLAFAQRGSPARRAALYGAATGLVWSVDAAFVKATTNLLAAQGWLALLVHWPLYGAVITGVLGTFLLQASLHVGPLAASQSAVLIVDPLASIVLGIEVFGEQLNNSAPAITGQVRSLAMMALGVVLISKWAPPSMEPLRRGKQLSPT